MMQFDVRRNAYFDSICRLIDGGPSIASSLARVGVCDLNTFLNGITSEAQTFLTEYSKTTSVGCRIEGRWVGYRSSLVNAVLDEVGLSEMDPYDLHRSEEVESRVAAHPLLQHFSRARFIALWGASDIESAREAQVSSMHRIGQDLIMSDLGFSADQALDLFTKKQALDAVSNACASVGLKAKKEPKSNSDLSYGNEDLLGSTRLYFRIRAFPGFQQGFSFDLEVGTDRDLTIDLDGTSYRVPKPQLRVQESSWLPRSSMYSTSLFKEQFLLSLYMHVKQIPLLVEHLRGPC